MKFHAGQPDVEQQQIVEDFGKADSTMRILERLIEKEQEVYKTIGDAAVLLALHDSAREEEYLTQGAASGKAVEELLPAHPQEPAWVEGDHGAGDPGGAGRRPAQRSPEPLPRWSGRRIIGWCGGCLRIGWGHRVQAGVDTDARKWSGYCLPAEN